MADQGVDRVIGGGFRRSGRRAGYERLGPLAESVKALLARPEAAPGGLCKAAKLAAAHGLLVSVSGRRREARLQKDAIHWAGRQTKAAPYAFIVDNGMGESAAADDGIHRAGRQAARAAHAQGFVNSRYRGLHRLAQRTRIPGSAPSSGDRRKTRESPSPAARIMPSETPKRILRGLRFATSTTLRPTRIDGA